VRPFLFATGLWVVVVSSMGAVVAACGDDSSSGDNSQSPVPPSNCTEPCKAGTICFGPAEPACNGTWYCQSDQKWQCSPADTGGPGGFPDATTLDDGPDESTTDAPPAEGSTRDASKDAPKG
jgi:hypothetical protein